MEISVVINGISYDFQNEEELVEMLAANAHIIADTDEQNGVYSIFD